MPSKRQRRSGKRLRKAKSPRKKLPEIITELINQSDIILEILDSRFINETRNKEIEEIIKKNNKLIIYVLNKVDLIEKRKIYELELEHLKPRVLISAIRRWGGRELRRKIKSLAKTFKKEKVVVGIIGYPNTGKSSVINLLIGKNSAKTAIIAGFTKGIQKLRLSKGVVLLDSPGVIPNKEYSNVDQRKMTKNAMIGARDYNKIKEPELVIDSLLEKYKLSFEKYYNLKAEDGDDLIEQIGKKKHLLKKGGLADTDRIARLILKHWQEGKIKVILE